MKTLMLFAVILTGSISFSAATVSQEVVSQIEVVSLQDQPSVMETRCLSIVDGDIALRPKYPSLRLGGEDSNETQSYSSCGSSEIEVFGHNTAISSLDELGDAKLLKSGKLKNSEVIFNRTDETLYVLLTDVHSDNGDECSIGVFTTLPSGEKASHVVNFRSNLTCNLEKTPIEVMPDSNIWFKGEDEDVTMSYVVLEPDFGVSIANL